jgi:glycosyltransferase involved in cell wall biosynthesis
MKVSIVVPVYNRKDQIVRCVKALQEQNFSKDNYEIVVIDDGSAEDLAFLKEFGVRYFKKDNEGPGIARNKGAKMAEGDIILFTDSDCVPEPDWIEEMVTGFEENVGLVGGETIEVKYNNLFDLFEKNIGNFEYYFPSNNMGVRKEMFERVGGFNTFYKYPGAEDVDLSLKIQRLGYKLKQVKAGIQHHHKKNLRKMLKTSFVYGRGDAQFLILNKEQRKFKPLYNLYFPLASLRFSFVQVKKLGRYDLFPLFLGLNFLEMGFNILGRIRELVMRRRFRLIFYNSVYKLQ